MARPAALDATPSPAASGLPTSGLPTAALALALALACAGATHGADAQERPSAAGSRDVLPGPRVPPDDLMHATAAPAGAPATGADPVSGWWISEKLDGVRGRWDGRRLWTRGGLPVDAPAWFTEGWPDLPMDGELWVGRGRFQDVSSLVRNTHPDDPAWRDLRFLVFDLPAHGGPFEERVRAMRALRAAGLPPWLRPLAQSRVANAAQLDARLRAVLEAGGEGLMLHRGDARYAPGRSDALRKLKPHQDAEARVVAHLPGRGRYAGQVGALLVERDDGARFRIGSGLDDADRADPPPPGSLVTYRYSGLTVNGLPRFPRYLRLREPPPAPPAGATPEVRP